MSCNVVNVGFLIFLTANNTQAYIREGTSVSCKKMIPFSLPIKIM